MDQIREIFTYIDKDGSNLISKDEARELFERLENSNISESEYDALLAEIDKDNDGTVSFTEFIPLGKLLLENGITSEALKARSETRTLQESSSYTSDQLAQIRSIFDIVDTDGSGAIDIDELAAAMRQLGNRFLKYIIDFF